MKTFVLFLYLTTTVLAVGEKQLKLDDIEKDNLATERQLKQEKQATGSKLVAATSQQTQKLISPGQLQYGFKPLARPQQQIQSQQVQIPQTQQYFYPQYTTQLPYVHLQPQYQYQHYENVPYVVDNRLVQSSKTDQQQFFGQQLVYLQPFTSSSANIQTVVDPKGEIKYYMYVPTQYVSEVKNNNEPAEAIQVQTVDPSYNNVGPQIFTREPDYRQLPQSESQYITQPQLPPQPVTHTSEQYLQPTPEAPQIHYVQQSTPTQQPVEPLPKAQYSSKGAPQSLLDSYVPSILQLQYYKQQQQQVRQANAVESPKTPIPRTTLTRQTLRIPNAQIETTYSLPLPSTYRTQNVKN